MEPKDLNSSESNSSQESNATESNATGPDTQVEEVVSEPTWLDGVMQEGALGMLLEGGLHVAHPHSCHRRIGRGHRAIPEPEDA